MRIRQKFRTMLQSIVLVKFLMIVPKKLDVFHSWKQQHMRTKFIRTIVKSMTMRMSHVLMNRTRRNIRMFYIAIEFQQVTTTTATLKTQMRMLRLYSPITWCLFRGYQKKAKLAKTLRCWPFTIRISLFSVINSISSINAIKQNVHLMCN